VTKKRTLRRALASRKPWAWTNDAPEPLRDALRVLCGGKAPPPYVTGYDYSNLTDSERDQLQNWVSLNLAAGIYWSTAIGVIEAAEKLVEEAVANANIPPKPGSE
jgi:hypothetical protein